MNRGLLDLIDGVDAVADAARLGGERQYGEMVGAGQRSGLLQKGVDSLVPLVADALAPVHGEDHEQLAGRPDQVQTRQGQEQEDHNRRAQPERQAPLPSCEIDQAAIEEIDHGRQRGQAQQPPHAGQLELDVEWQRGCAHQSIHLR